MITRRRLLAGAAATTILTVVPGPASQAAPRDARRWAGTTSANGWPVHAPGIAAHRVAGSAATVRLRDGAAAAVLLHIARRWHYEIAPIDTGEGGGIAGYEPQRAVRADFESNYLSGTAIALHPKAYPIGGSEPLWPHHEAIIRDILVDCDGAVSWGGSLTPPTASHFHIATAPGDRALIRVATRLATDKHRADATQTAGTVIDPATPARREAARRLPRPR